MSRTIQIVAGPNGSGKTTFAETFFKKRNGHSLYINPDIIAAGISPIHVEQASFQAGRLMITSIKDSIAKGESFAFESTLSGKTWLPLLNQALENGFEISIYFLFLKEVRQNIERIQHRVEQGGHFVPTKAVKRRYLRSFGNFWNLYRPLATNWFVFDNSNKRPELVLSKATYEALMDLEQKTVSSNFIRGKVK